APPRTTSSIRSERYDDHDESRLPTKISSATTSSRRIWQSMWRPSWPPGARGDDQVGALYPFRRNRNSEPPRVIEIHRAADLHGRVERDSRRVGAMDDLADHEAGFAAVFGVVGSDTEHSTAIYVSGRQGEERRPRHFVRARDRRERGVGQVVGDLAEHVDSRLAEGKG